MNIVLKWYVHAVEVLAVVWISVCMEQVRTGARESHVEWLCAVVMHCDI